MGGANNKQSLGLSPLLLFRLLAWPAFFLRRGTFTFSSTNPRLRVLGPYDTPITAPVLLVLGGFIV
jgi:hypothetical protein